MLKAVSKWSGLCGTYKMVCVCVLKEINPKYYWKDCCWSHSSNTSGTWCEELTHWKRPWCWDRLRAGGDGDNRGWDGWMASPTRWTWVWVNSGSWWWTGRPGVLRFMGSQRVGHDWATELNWLTDAPVWLITRERYTHTHTMCILTTLSSTETQF